MREYLFRGKTTQTEAPEWQYGSLVIVNSEPKQYIIKQTDGHFGFEHIVDERSIGQYIELNDHSEERKMVFEGDVLMFTGIMKEPVFGIVRFGIAHSWNGYATQGFYVDFSFENYLLRNDIVWWLTKQTKVKVTVAGNIYDNPELLGL